MTKLYVKTMAGHFSKLVRLDDDGTERTLVRLDSLDGGTVVRCMDFQSGFRSEMEPEDGARWFASVVLGKFFEHAAPRGLRHG